MNSKNFDRILYQVFLVPILVVLLGAGAIFWQMRDANRTVTRIQSADQSIAETLVIEKLVVDQETGLRGYQTTGDRRFLEPFREAGRQLPAHFALRRALAIQPQVKAEISELQQEHEVWEQGFAIPLIASITAGAKTSDPDLNLLGKQRIDDIRSRLSNLSNVAQKRRDESIDRWHQQVRSMSFALLGLAITVGLVIGVYTRGLLHDVSDAFRQSHDVLRVKAEETFRSEQRLRMTLQSIGDGVITCDAEGRVQSMNDVAQQLTGWSEAEACDRPLAEVFHILDESTRQPVENPVDKVKRLNHVVSLANHTILLRKDKSEIFINDSGAPILDKRGALAGIVLVFRDVTMEKKSREALLANEKLAVAGRLAATIAHEIHNPLDSVSNLLFLMDGNPNPQENSHFLTLAKQEIDRVTQISRAMLGLYRESKAPVTIDLKEMLESTLLLMQRQFAALEVTAVSELPDGLVIRGFPAELRQVFTNLLTNAAEASSPNGLIRVSGRTCPPSVGPKAKQRDAGVMITVTDAGPGIPDSIRSSLFHPFFTTKGERGTGLGLWVSQGIVTKHGGTIELASHTGEHDHGTAVMIFLSNDPVINAGG